MAAEILNKYAEQVERITLTGGVGGSFEVSVNGEQVHSKLATKRYPELSEITEAIAKRLG